MKNLRINLTLICGITLLFVILIGLAGCSSPSAEAAPNGPTYPLEINLLDKTGQYTLDSQGRLKSTVQLSSPDGSMGLYIYSGTKILDKDSQPLQTITAIVDSRPPLLPENKDIVGLVYDITPVAAQFNPSLQFTFSYKLQDLPAGANENDLYVASYENGVWNEIRYKKIDTTHHKITTTLDQGATIALLIPLQETAGTTASTPIVTPTVPANPNAVKVVVAGYLDHGPMQPTVQAIKDVLAKYGNKVSVTWVDLGTSAGEAYFKANNLSAHMNVIINGKYTYNVNGKNVTFQWFEGQQWTKADLDAVLANLTSNE